MGKQVPQQDELVHAFEIVALVVLLV
jgi:hypothetical protein